MAENPAFLIRDATAMIERLGAERDKAQQQGERGEFPCRVESNHLSEQPPTWAEELKRANWAAIERRNEAKEAQQQVEVLASALRLAYPYVKDQVDDTGPGEIAAEDVSRFPKPSAQD